VRRKQPIQGDPHDKIRRGTSGETGSRLEAPATNRPTAGRRKVERSGQFGRLLQSVLNPGKRPLSPPLAHGRRWVQDGALALPKTITL